VHIYVKVITLKLLILSHHCAQTDHTKRDGRLNQLEKGKGGGLKS
jgi:hypothetical protein